MKKFVLTTQSNSGDHYMYFIEHSEKPTPDQLYNWLLKNGNDIDGNNCYEYPEMVVEIDKFKKL